MALTAKIDLSNRKVQLFLFDKIAALNSLVAMGGFKNTAEYISESDLSLCRQCWQVLNSDSHPIIKLAAASFLDMLLPEWRDTIATSKIIWPIVKRNSNPVAKWVKACKIRNRFICVDCGSSEKLHVHHIMPWAYYPELRIEVSNGMTLCKDCHSQKHLNMSALMFN